MQQLSIIRKQSQAGWVAVPGTAGISKRVTSDQREAGINLKVLVPIANMNCSHNEY